MKRACLWLALAAILVTVALFKGFNPAGLLLGFGALVTAFIATILWTYIKL